MSFSNILPQLAATACFSPFFLLALPCHAFRIKPSASRSPTCQCRWMCVGTFSKFSAFNYWLRFEELFSVFCFLCDVSPWMFVSLLQRAVKMQRQAGRGIRTGSQSQRTDSGNLYEVFCSRIKGLPQEKIAANPKVLNMPKLTWRLSGKLR